MISWRDRGTKSYEALMTSCRYWPCVAHDAPISHWMLGGGLVSSGRVKQRLVEDPLGGVVEQRQERLGHHLSVEPKMDPVIGDVFDVPQARQRSIRSAVSSGSKSSSTSCGTAATHASAETSVPSSSTAAGKAIVFAREFRERRCAAHFPPLLVDRPRGNLHTSSPSGTVGIPTR